MKKILLTLGLVIVTALSFGQNNKLPIDAGTPKAKPGQVSAQSSSFSMDEKGVNFLYLNDGQSNLSAISYTISPIKGFNGRLRLQALGAADPADTSHKAYLTTGLGYNLFNAASGFRLDLFAGPKGFNVADGFKFQSGKNSFVFGFGISIPLG
jgi:hypothetical protein